MLKNTIEKLLSDIKSLKKDAACTLPQNVFYLNDDDILCEERESGESRFPYTHDGMVLWAYSNGYMNANECNMKIFHSTRAYEEACIDFFACLPQADGTFMPISLTGATKQLFEPGKITRYVVFHRECAYYITETENAVFCLRAFVSTEKKICFSFCGINTGSDNLRFTFASYIEPLLTFTNDPGYWSKMAVTGKYAGNGNYVINRNEYISRNIAVISQNVSGGKIVSESHSVSRGSLTGGYGRGLHNAKALKYGKFDKEIHAITRLDFPAAADMYQLEVGSGENIRIDYTISLIYDESLIESTMSQSIIPEKLDRDISSIKQNIDNALDGFKITFGELKDNDVNNVLLNRFLKSVQYEVSFFAMNKEYGGRYLGMRDVFQQMESAVMWQPNDVRSRIVRWFNYFTDTGRTPRSVAIELHEGMLPLVICEEYVDQGLWVISCVYNYLCYTDDYSVLDEKCGFYHIIDENNKWIKTNEVTTVLDHLLRIMKYFISKLDTEYGTNCLRVLMGDWNDSINGLGATDDSDKDFGSGVSVMSSLQLYKNFEEMTEILSHIGGYDELCEEYTLCRRRMEEGLIKYAIDRKDGDKQIIHGWGDKLSYKVGSMCDEDGSRRYNLIANAFWILSKMITTDPSMKKYILENYAQLDSRFGYITFKPAFTRDMVGVGRMRFILPGNAENACAYIHASMFANMSLFAIGEPDLAWKQIKKSIVITHDNINLSPYVMCNQYCDNSEYNSNGEAITDWATGSGTTLIKSIVTYGFGIQPSLDNITIATARVMPSDKSEIQIKISGKTLNIIYRNEGLGKRRFTVNGTPAKTEFDALYNTERVIIDKQIPANILNILITD